MRYNRLGKTNIFVSSIGLGTWGFGGFFTADRTDDSKFIELILTALDLGINVIDTAEAYGAGHSEEIIGRALAVRSRDSVIISTKVSPENLNYKNLILAAENSLKRLQTDYIDLYKIHWPNPMIPLEESLEAMDKLITAGKVRFAGVSNFSLAKIKNARNIYGNIEAVQVEYNLFDRTIEADILPFCVRENISLFAYSPLDQGKLLADQSKQKIMEDISAKYNCSPHQVILNWLITNQQVIPIPKSMKIDHLKQNACSADFSLSAEDFITIADSFHECPISIPTDLINTDKKGLEAFVPSPDQLAEEIRKGESIKPIRVKLSETTKDRYNLVEGKMRYWAWTIAFNGEKPIAALIRN